MAPSVFETKIVLASFRGRKEEVEGRKREVHGAAVVWIGHGSVWREKGQKKAYKGGSWWGPPLTLQDRSITWDLGLGWA